MEHSTYEKHDYADPDFPVIFHYDVVTEGTNFLLHWHESIEILFFTKGCGRVFCDLNPVSASVGDVVIINGNELHSIQAITPQAEYYCLIIAGEIYEELIQNINHLQFASILSGDPKVGELMMQIAEEFEQNNFAYQAAIRSHIISLMVHLTRNYAAAELPLPKNHKKNSRIELVKGALSYMKSNYKNEFSIDDLCKTIGFSKYYFCRTFKEVTGKTAIEYLNMLRCQRAQKLLASGRCNVSQAAEQCGFHNMAYFCKVYQKTMGRLPSHEKGASLEMK